MAYSMELNYSVELSGLLIPENVTQLELFENTSKRTPFVNPFSKQSVRAIFCTVYGLVFTLCFFGKYI